jgi:phage terminase large subunit-like protein
VCRGHRVDAVACDPSRWQRSLDVLLDEGLPMVEWPSHSVGRMVAACAQFNDGVTTGRITHDGDPRLADHVANAVLKVDGRGPRITEEHRTSRRHIDLAVAAVMAYDVANAREPQQRSVYEERDLMVL